MPEMRDDTGRAAGGGRLDDLRSDAQRAWQSTLAVWTQAQGCWERRPGAVKISKHELLTDSAFARLYARSLSMPVIEQAKGVLMYQQQCSEAEAFELLRRASQRSNVPIRVLAERIVQGVQRRQAGQSPA